MPEPRTHTDAQDGGLGDRFAMLAAADLAPATPLVQVRRRVATRRRRRRRAIAGTGAAAVLLMVGVAAAVRAPAPARDQRVTTEPTTGPATTTTLPPTATTGAGARLVLGPTPEGLAFSSCDLLEVDAVACHYDIPGTAIPDGVTVNLTTAPLDEALRRAWAAGDAVAVATSVRGPSQADAHFTTLGGRRVVEATAGPPFDGDSLGLPDRSFRSFDLLVDDHHVQVIAEGLSAAQLDAVVAGFSFAAADPGFDLPDGVLPEGTRLAAQGPITPWDQPDPLHPERSTRLPGRSTVAFYALPGHRMGLEVRVTTAVDADEVLDDADRRDAAGRDATRTKLDGREALVAPPHDPRLQMERRAVMAAVDDETVVTVTGPPSRDDLTHQLAATITLR